MQIILAFQSSNGEKQYPKIKSGRCLEGVREIEAPEAGRGTADLCLNLHIPHQCTFK